MKNYTKSSGVSHDDELSLKGNEFSISNSISKMIALNPKMTGMLAVCSLIIFLALFEWLLSSGYQPQTRCPYKWAGGSPAFNKGSCWCGEDHYCMCTPSLAIDVLIEVLPDNAAPGEKISLNEVSLLMVHRKDPPVGHAIMGGFVDVGESVEHACVREMKEEINWSTREEDLELFKIYSDPTRDLRRHTVSAVHIVSTSKQALGNDIHSGDDAKGLKFVSLKTLHDQGKISTGSGEGLEHDTPVAHSIHIAFDHEKIIRDFIENRCMSGRYMCT